MGTLVNLFDKYKCDKGSLKHRYDRVYEPALKHLQNKKFNLLEIGIFKGPSLEAWVEYFPYANLFGIDIFTRIKPNEIQILNHPRVSWCRCDSIKGPNDEFKSMTESGFDVIIDDGKHTYDAQLATFKNFIPFLNKDGVYFIEDVWPFHLMSEKEKQHKWILQHQNEFSDKQYEQLIETINQYRVNYHDIRRGYEPDTFIIEIKK
jgi:hypothetical protein